MSGLSVFHRGGAFPTVHNRTLILVRWVAVMGQAATLVLVHHGLGMPLHLAWAFGVVGASALFNIMMSGGLGRRRGPGSVAETTLSLAFDTVQLAALLYVTGGLGNPFSILMLAPVTVAASLLPARQVAEIAALALAGVALLSETVVPLPWPGPLPELSVIYALGVFLALAFSIVFMALYVWRASSDARNLTRALDETRMALARQQQAVALGAQAAAAAHELGSPLSTIYVIASDLKKEVPQESPLAEDVGLLYSQSLRCKDILAGFSKAPKAAKDQDLIGPYWPQALVATIVEPYRVENPAIEVRIESGEDAKGSSKGRSGGAMPALPRKPEIVSGLGNVFQNAIQHARSVVAIRNAWDRDFFTISVEDDGPGFPAAVLSRIGEPYISTRPEGGGGMGLGIFISKTLLGQTGAEVQFSNAPGGGGRVTIRWSRKDIEIPQ